MKTFKLFSCCIPVKGASRSIICDLQRNTFLFITDQIYNFLTEFSENINNNTCFDNDENKEAVEFLIENEYGFYTEDTCLFPKINLNWESPVSITNAIVDFDKNSNHNISQIVKQLSDLYCGFIELRFYDNKEAKLLYEILSFFKDSTFRGINILLKYNNSLKKVDFYDFIEKNKRVKQIILHSTNNIDKIVDIHKYSKLIYTSEIISSENCCGNISPYYFRSNIYHFTESQKYNTCLNRKVCIDKKGFIKNCPSMKNNYGNINDVTIIDVINNRAFKKFWKINKDKITVCKDCEFRYICTDCRAFIKEINNIYSQPLKCKYNPYIEKWENDEGYLPVEECITYPKN